MSRLVPFLVFLAVALSLVGGMHYYVWARLVRDPQLPGGAARFATAVIIALGVALPLALVAARFVRVPAVRPALMLAFLWMGIGFMLVAFLGLADAGRLAVRLAQRLAGAEPDPERRVFLARALAAGVGGVVAGLSALGVRSALGPVPVKELEVALPRLPRALHGTRIVQISDVHIGPLLRHDWLAHVVDGVMALQPDLIAITGDLVDGSVEELSAHVAPLARLRARHGVFFSTGNHEYYSGVHEWVAHLPTLGVKPLMNEHVQVAPGLAVAGIEDPSGRPDLQRAIAGAEGAVVLLAHQPRQFAGAVKAGVDLVLSGHTHGGQIWPFSWVVALVQPFLAGLHRRGQSQLYVSRGTGFWGPPLRVFAPPEITLLKLSSPA